MAEPRVRAAAVALGDVVMVDGHRRVVAAVLRHRVAAPRGLEAGTTLTFAEPIFPGILTFADYYIFPPLKQDVR